MNAMKRAFPIISEDRLSDSLITGMNIIDNLLLRDYKKLPFAKHSIVKSQCDEKKMQKEKDAAVSGACLR